MNSCHCSYWWEEDSVPLLYQENGVELYVIFSQWKVMEVPCHVFHLTFFYDAFVFVCRWTMAQGWGETRVWCGEQQHFTRVCPSITSSQGPLVLTERGREARGEFDGPLHEKKYKYKYSEKKYDNTKADMKKYNRLEKEKVTRGEVLKLLRSVNLNHIWPFTSPACSRSKITSTYPYWYVE